MEPSSYRQSTMKACRLHGIGDFRTDEVRIPEPVGEQLLIKVGACGVCGSDIPRIFTLGTSKQRYPLTIGHEFGGKIVEVGDDADPSLVGTRGAIFPCIPCRSCGACLSGNYAMCEDYDYLGSRSDGGFARYCLVPSAWHVVFSTDPKTTDDSLAMVEPCTVAQHALRRGEVRAGMNVLIFGAGPIGIMAERWARIFGARTVAICEIVEEKVEFARQRGAQVINGSACDIREAFRELSAGRDADVVIEGTGTGAALGQAIECARTFGTVVLLGNPVRDTTISLSQHSAILRKELSLKGIWNSHYAATPVNEWQFSVAMIDAGDMIVDDLVTAICDLDELPGLCRDIFERRVTVCKAICRPRTQS
ncbi:Alcohol dehydrogenase GroES domain protein [Coriobacterium glomerans PW2]|uniref:Alcohol dehydrogenase GroES domain protein n=1 Tax=Coriobacterium glomerans (strain ATCC 49209 / DSM 20642 / JCM 10262 / PW2) TaxID=700015 RepID=F2N8E8_CORGP|nr:galactitol-1-phosphate 5-dehydrogenase [Coriobacterium glomerans]AEB07331.1 Alcohol dehydrogenase GroES domain protein [Coriobacterium glomerans PW2]